MPDTDPERVTGVPAGRWWWPRRWPVRLGLLFLLTVIIGCVGTLPYTLGQELGTPRYKHDDPRAVRLPPWWITPSAEEAARLDSLVGTAAPEGPAAFRPRYWLGTDLLGRSVLVRCLAGGGVSLGIGIAAAFISVLIGTFYGALAAYAGGVVDAVMMRIVDVLYGLPYVLLVVLLAVASDALVDEYLTRSHERARWMEQRAAATAEQRGLSRGPGVARELLRADADLRSVLETRALEVLPPRTISDGTRTAIDIATLLVAIGGVSWLTMARVVRGQVLSLKAQPFMEAARAIGVPWARQFTRHLLPNLVGPIVVYATLTIPQAVLQESFLSFLGIGVKPPLPSWGNLAADGLGELNGYKSHWWLLLFPCAMLGATLLALNFVGEGLREALDPRRRNRVEG